MMLLLVECFVMMLLNPVAKPCHKP
jgi:hypothetical protein